VNRVERGSGMNKEHFIIELKIYLKALNPKDQAIILAKYKALFDGSSVSPSATRASNNALYFARIIA
jgi:hypothetical protein